MQRAHRDSAVCVMGNETARLSQRMQNNATLCDVCTEKRGEMTENN